MEILQILNQQKIKTFLTSIPFRLIRQFMKQNVLKLYKVMMNVQSFAQGQQLPLNHKVITITYYCMQTVCTYNPIIRHGQWRIETKATICYGTIISCYLHRELSWVIYSYKENITSTMILFVRWSITMLFVLHSYSFVLRKEVIMIYKRKKIINCSLIF